MVTIPPQDPRGPNLAILLIVACIILTAIFIAAAIIILFPTWLGLN